jgi:hypothetical protein
MSRRKAVCHGGTLFGVENRSLIPDLSLCFCYLDKAIGQGAMHNAGEDYWPWPGRSPMQAQPLFVMVK